MRSRKRQVAIMRSNNNYYYCYYYFFQFKHLLVDVVDRHIRPSEETTRHQDMRPHNQSAMHRAHHLLLLQPTAWLVPE